MFQTSSYLNTFGFVVMQIDFCEEQLTFDNPEIEKKIQIESEAVLGSSKYGVKLFPLPMRRVREDHRRRQNFGWLVGVGPCGGGRTSTFLPQKLHY